MGYWLSTNCHPFFAWPWERNGSTAFMARRSLLVSMVTSPPLLAWQARQVEPLFLNRAEGCRFAAPLWWFSVVLAVPDELIITHPCWLGSTFDQANIAAPWTATIVVESIAVEAWSSKLMYSMLSTLAAHGRLEMCSITWIKFFIFLLVTRLINNMLHLQGEFKCLSFWRSFSLIVLYNDAL